MSDFSEKTRKRPRGLLKSRKDQTEDDGDSPSKRVRREESSTGQDSPATEIQTAEKSVVELEDWEDLKELFGNALDAFEGDSPASAAPLLRGVIHECDRFQRHQEDPTSIYMALPSGSTTQTQSSDSRLAFYSIHGTSLYLLGTLIAQDPSILSQGEPEEPTKFLKAAISVFESGSNDATSSPNAPVDHWKSWLQFIWGQAVLASFDTDPDSVEYSAAINTSLEAASQHFSTCVQCLPPLSEAAEDRDPWHLSRIKVLAEASVMFFASAESADPGNRAKWSGWLVETFLEEPGEGDISMKIAIWKVKGRCWLTLASDSIEEVEEMFDREDEDEDELWKSLPVTKGIDLVNKALVCFISARDLLSSNGVGQEDLELLKLYGEALLTLANLTQDLEERERLYNKVKDETGIDPEGGSEDEDEDEDIQ